MTDAGAALVVAPLRRHPELEPSVWDPALSGVWPTFLTKDPASRLYYGRLERFLDFALVAFDPARPAVALGRAFAVPFRLDPALGRERLPEGGWGEVIRWGDDDQVHGRATNAVSALEIALRPEAAGRGHAGRILEALRGHVRGLGYADLYAPVRPNLKHLEPRTPMRAYAERTRADGLPFDPWLRVHVRAGGRIVGVAPCAMTVAGSLASWRSWTGLPFDRSGEVQVQGALVPVHASLEHDHAVYVEPAVWVHHTL